MLTSLALDSADVYRPHAVSAHSYVYVLICHGVLETMRVLYFRYILSMPSRDGSELVGKLNLPLFDVASAQTLIFYLWAHLVFFKCSLLFEPSFARHKSSRPHPEFQDFDGS